MSVEEQIEATLDLMEQEIDSYSWLSMKCMRTELMYLQGCHLGSVELGQDDLMTLDQLHRWQNKWQHLYEHDIPSECYQVIAQQLHRLKRIADKKSFLYVLSHKQFINWQDYWRQSDSDVDFEQVKEQIKAWNRVGYFCQVNDELRWIPIQFPQDWIPNRPGRWQWLFPGFHVRYLLVHDSQLSIDFVGRFLGLMSMDSIHMDQLSSYERMVFELLNELAHERQRVDILTLTLWWLFSWFSWHVCQLWEERMMAHQIDIEMKIAAHVLQLLERPALSGSELQCILRLINAIDLVDEQKENICNAIKMHLTRFHMLSDALVQLWEKSHQIHGWKKVLNSISDIESGQKMICLNSTSSMSMLKEKDKVERLIQLALECVDWSHILDLFQVNYSNKNMTLWIEECLIMELMLCLEHPFWMRILGPEQTVPKRMSHEHRMWQQMMLNPNQRWQSLVMIFGRSSWAKRAQVSSMIRVWIDQEESCMEMKQCRVLQTGLLDHPDLKQKLRQTLWQKYSDIMTEDQYHYECIKRFPWTQQIFKWDKRLLVRLEIQTKLFELNLNIKQGKTTSINAVCQWLQSKLDDNDADTILIKITIKKLIQSIFITLDHDDTKIMLLLRSLTQRYQGLVDEEWISIINNSDFIMQGIMQIGVEQSPSDLQRSFSNGMYLAKIGMLTQYQRTILWYQSVMSNELKEDQLQVLHKIYLDHGWRIAC